MARCRTLSKEYQPIVAVRLPIGKETRCLSWPRPSARRGRGVLVARLLIGQEPQRVEQGAVGQHLVVQVIAGGAAGAADAPDDVAALHLIALAHGERLQ